MATEIRQLALVKKGQHYIFRYQPGEEASLIQALMDKAEDPNCPLDWFDAAILSHRLGNSMATELQTIIRAKLGLGSSNQKAADAT